MSIFSRRCFTIVKTEIFKKPMILERAKKQKHKKQRGNNKKKKKKARKKKAVRLNSPNRCFDQETDRSSCHRTTHSSAVSSKPRIVNSKIAHVLLIATKNTTSSTRLRIDDSENPQMPYRSTGQNWQSRVSILACRGLGGCTDH